MPLLVDSTEGAEELGDHLCHMTLSPGELTLIESRGKLTVHTEEVRKVRREGKERE